MAKLKKKNLDLIRAVRRKSSEEAGKEIKVAAFFLLLALLTGFFLLRNAWYLNETRKLQRETGEIRSYLNQAEIRMGIQEADELHDEVEKLKKFREELESTHLLLSAWPKPEGETIREVLKAGEGKVMVTNMSYDGKVLRFTAEVRDYRDASPYIRRIENLGLFDSVGYGGIENGYGSDERETAFQFTVTCALLKAYEGEEP